MDGCNVNCKFYHNLFQECKGEELTDLLNIFSSSSNIYCSLHVVHGRFEKGAKELQAVICFPFDFVCIDG